MALSWHLTTPRVRRLGRLRMLAMNGVPLEDEVHVGGELEAGLVEDDEFLQGLLEQPE